MLKNGTSKLGEKIKHWSIPSGFKKICVGATLLCLAMCYAMRGHYRHTSVKDANEKALKQSRKRDFAQKMIEHIRATLPHIVRIHASGDFYSRAYVRKWIKIARGAKGTRFFGYTRSWRDSELLPWLLKLAAEPNVSLWFSCDRETGAPPESPHVRRAYMALNDHDHPDFPVDLVFRVDTRTVRKWYSYTLVCPAENGITTTTCSKCQLCFRKQSIPRKQKHADYSSKT
jgi:hypothetical protein